MNNRKQQIAEQAQRRVDAVLQRYVAAAKNLQGQGASEARQARLRSTYAEVLAAIFDSDVSFARLVQESDMLVRYAGLQADERWRPMSLFASVFGRVTKSVTGIATEIFRVEHGDAEDVTPSHSNVDIGLTDVVHGSLVLGMVARPVHADGKVLPQHVTRRAMEALSDAVTIAVSRGPEAVESAFDDAAVADAALHGIIGLMARKRDDKFEAVGVCSTQSFSGADRLPMLDHAAADLVHEHANRPADGGIDVLTGVCRGTDLDSKRMVLRLDADLGGHRVRVAIPKNVDVSEEQMREWLNAGRIEVTGHLTTNKLGRATLVRAQKAPRTIDRRRSS